MWCRALIPVSVQGVNAGADREVVARRRRRRALTASFAVVVALAAAGCSSDAETGSTNSPPMVTGEQVVTSCFQNYFYNGILPKASAEANCKSCVVDQLHKLGVKPASGENVVDMLTGDRLSNSTIQSLQSNCNETDANEQ
jgi:hypothetical protein